MPFFNECEDCYDARTLIQLLRLSTGSQRSPGGEREPIHSRPFQEHRKVVLFTRRHDKRAGPRSQACCRPKHIQVFGTIANWSPLEQDALGILNVFRPTNPQPLPQESTGVLRKHTLHPCHCPGARGAANVPPRAACL